MLLVTMLMFATSAMAQAKFPEKPINLVVPYSAGTGADALARQLAAVMPGLLGQPMVVENKAGGSAQIGSQAVARSAADGYSLLVGNDQVMCFNPVLYKTLPYHPTRDFVPVAGLTLHPYVLAVPNSLNVKTVAELVALAKAKPGSLSFASTGIATSAHLTGELLKAEAQIELTHVPYQSAAQLFPDLIEGRVSMLFYPYQQLKPYIDSGKLRALATTTERRSTWLKDVPAMPEIGYPKIIQGAWAGIYAPANTPADRVTRLSEAFKMALEKPEVNGPLTAGGIEVAYRTPNELAAFAAQKLDVCQEVVKIAKVKLE
ncbi:Bug family tripartite tricarboxylate transporter substrate binding protein [Variovorax brevis]|uniref:Bug family tripartite tricarboxylate transporter substrate binding protein n=1 Tax=Variovorax brevis TaxID=3053503 RepID=UPI002577D1ED|nr:tripartite tricarboxylate transporter substrate binding protein [Variovorax sp. J22R133]